jgi:anti-sigma factor RsiW
MTACRRFAPMIGARPGELTDEEATALAEHLASCDACQARLADERAVSGMLSEALMAEANRRDFSSFSDGVLARIPAYGAAREGALHGERATPSRELSPRPAGRGLLSPLLSWVRHHRLAATASALVPTLAAAALILYLGRGNGPEPASVILSAEGRAATVLETSDGPVVLLGDPEPEGS